MADDNKLVKWTGEQKDWKGYAKQKKGYKLRNEGDFEGYDICGSRVTLGHMQLTHGICIAKKLELFCRGSPSGICS